jgi:hypothetical protein
MTTLPAGIPSSQRPPVNSVQRTAPAVPADLVFDLAEDSREESHTRLQSLEQLICALLIKNQQLRRALVEMKALEPSEVQAARYKASEGTGASSQVNVLGL